MGNVSPARLALHPYVGLGYPLSMQLVFHAGPLNEFMLLIPLMRAMDRPLTVVAPWQRASMASHLIGATPMDIELFEFTRLHAENGPSRVSPAVSDLFTNATRIISFLSSQEDAWAANVRRLSPNAELLLLEPRPPTETDKHFTTSQRDTLSKLGLDLQPIEPEPLSNPNGPIIVHPGSSAIKRCWPVERYEDLILELRALGHSVQPIMGEVELERWSPDRIEHWTTRLKAQVVRSAEALVPTFSEAKLYVGNDAGPLYIAAQLGTPTLAIVGPSVPAKSGPLGEHVRFVAPPDGPGRIEDVTLKSVVDAIGLA